MSGKEPFDNGQTSTVPGEKDDRSGFFRGFSLIELMLVVAIISILTAVAFLSMLHYGLVLRANASARDLGGHLRLARAAAIRDGQTYLFSFGSASFLYGIDADQNGTPDGTTKSYALQPGIIYGFMVGTSGVPGHPAPTTSPIIMGDVSACPSDTVFLLRDGSAACDGVAHIIPEKDASSTGQRDDRQRAVDWSASTGRVRVWKFGRDGHWR